LDGFSEDEIEQAMDWEGRPGRCLKAMIEVGLLDKSELNKRLESRKQTPEFSILKDYRSSWIYEIHGYFENSGTFRESEKKRKQREISNFVPGQSGDTERVLSRDCPPREEKRREEREERERAREPDIINERIPDNTQELKLEARYLEVMRSRGAKAILRLSLEDRDHLGELCRMTKEPMSALESFLADHRDFYVKCKWKLKILVQNLNDHNGVSAMSKPSIVDPDGSVKRREAFKSMSEDNKRRMKSEMAPTDPTLAAEQLRKIMEKIGV
jgi:hypothetical protein